MNLDEALSQRRILITCGTGGVGKTTVSAALALRAALLGRKTAVITIDPAKRLATSLGLDSLGDHPTDLTPQLRAAFDKAKASGLLGLPDEFTGTIDAIIPDTRKTFETFIAELAPTQALADRVMKNPIFQIFAQEFSGANEYMALERLYALDQLRKYDTIILDTPPSRNTLAFLNAPTLLARLFEEKLIKWLVLPANKLVATGMRKAMSILERLTGASFMTHLFDFASALFEIQESFTKNLNAIIALLRSSDVGFLMVTTLAPDTAPEAQHFIETLKTQKLHFDGLAVNRTLSYLKSSEKGEGSQNTEALEIISALQKRELRVLEQLKNNGVELSAKLPELARDVHSVEDLFHVAMALRPGNLA